MEQRLYEAALEGNVQSLHEILEEDRLVLDRTIVNDLKETPLHVATMRGRVDFVNEILNVNYELAGVFDSQGLSALHIASAKGYTEIVKLLLLANPAMCDACDRDGRNPIHIAAIKGRMSVLKELVPARIDAARAVVDRSGETILHLCVGKNQLEALKFLMETMDDHVFVNYKDHYGNTILHLAVVDKQIETIKYLIASDKVDVNVVNANGFTSLDILSQSTRRDTNDLAIGDFLREAGALRANHIVIRRPNIPPWVEPNAPNLSTPKSNLTQGEWLSKKRDALMVVASLIATMAFQSGMNPPGGVWQDDSKGDNSQNPIKSPHRAGEAIMAYNYPRYYPYFLRANTIGFVASLSTILLLISGLPFKRRPFMWILMMIMWLTVTSMALTYTISIVVITPENYKEPLAHVIEVAVTVWCGVMSLLLLGHTIRLFARWVRNGIYPKRRSATLVDANHGHGHV